jgi:adenylyltransferase/sulfurtransferase
MNPKLDFTESQLERYARHIILGEVGGTGQAKVLESKVLMIGAGGLGAPLLLYLAAAGVGTLGIADDDAVSLSNLQRQIIHKSADIGRRKTKSAEAAIHDVNPEVEVIGHDLRVAPENVMELIAPYDVIADGSDNFATRFLVNDACYLAKKTLVSAAILRFDGQLSTFKAHLGGDHPGLIPSCAEGGVLGAIAGVMGSLQATEVIKELIGAGESLSGSLVIYDALATRFRNVRLKRDPGCPLCGERATITDLSIHAKPEENRDERCETG